MDVRRFVVYFVALLGLVTAPFGLYYGSVDNVFASALAIVIVPLASMARRRGW